MDKKVVEKTAKEVVKRKRPDRSIAQTVHMEPGENTKYITHSLEVSSLPQVDMTEPELVLERVSEYFRLCAKNDMKPSVAGMALAFGVDRKTLWAWVNGVDSAYIPQESRNSLKKAYQLLNAQMEDYMQNGKINPVSGIFLMKNNMGYQDKQEFVLTPNNQLGEATSPEELQQKYLEDTASDYQGEE